MKRNFLALLIAIICTAAVRGEGGKLFDLPLLEGRTLDEKAFAGLLPVPIFELSGDLTAQSMAVARKAKPGYAGECDIDVTGSQVTEEIPGTDLFGAFYGTFASAHGKLECLTVGTGLVVPSRGRVEKLHDSLVHLIGPPSSMERRLKNGRPDPRTVQYVWEKSGNHLTLEVRDDDAFFDVELNYYPGEANPRYKRGRWIYQVFEGASSAVVLKEILDRVPLPTGDGPPVPQKPAEKELDQLKQYGEAFAVPHGRKWEIQDKPQVELLNRVLDERYAKLGPADSADHLLKIATSPIPGSDDPQIRMGAIHYLATRKNAEATDRLFKALESDNLLAIASWELGKRCEEKMLDRVFTMLDGGGAAADQAIWVIMSIEDPAPQKSAEKRIGKLASPQMRQRTAAALAHARR